MANIRLKLTALSPLHIGSGEVYEPTNFIMDEGVLYSFKDEDFYSNLPDIKKEAFMRILNENKSDSFVRIHKFVKENKNIAKEIAVGIVSVTEGLQKDYDRLLGQVRQFEGRGRTTERVFNKFEIQRIQRKQVKTEAEIYANTGYIVGSSLKGSISTAYQEFIYKKEGLKAVEQKFQAKGKEISNNIFKDFKVSDSVVKKVNTKVGFALNKERFKYDFHNSNANVKLSTYIEVIEPKSEFMVEINHGSLDIEEILESCTSHYMPIFRSLFLDKVNGKAEYINKYLSSDFYESYRHLQLKPNQYLLRVGKHSGARAVTIDGMRKIKSLISSKPYSTKIREDETTTWLFGEKSSSNSGLLPFGWVLAEISEANDSNQEAIDGLYAVQVQRVKERGEKELAIEEKLRQDEEERVQRELQEEKRLASMTPIQRLIDSYDDIAKLINDMRAGAIEDLENIKIELAKEIKKELQKTPKTWDKAKKKALGRKNFIEELLR